MAPGDGDELVIMGEESEPDRGPLDPAKLGPAWPPAAPAAPGEHVYPGVGVRTRR